MAWRPKSGMSDKAGGITIIESAIRVLDEKEQELVEALEAVGVRRNVATIIVYLKDIDEATSRDIEKGSGLRQPEVSIAMRTLREKGWIAQRDVKGTGKGRPTRFYRLTMSIDEIIGHYEEEKRSESSRAMQSIQRLKEISAT
jgi:predicted transcriptional regulator